MTYLKAKALDKLNPEHITTNKVQYWSDTGIMLTAQMANNDAKDLVLKGKAFVVTSQAIGQIIN